MSYLHPSVRQVMLHGDVHLQSVELDGFDLAIIANERDEDRYKLVFREFKPPQYRRRVFTVRLDDPDDLVIRLLLKDYNKLCNLLWGWQPEAKLEEMAEVKPRNPIYLG